jgi:hypothetical protein
MIFKSFLLSSLLATGLALYIPHEDITSKECDCSGKHVRKNDNLGRIYVCGDERLGPRDLPTKLPLSTFVTGYDRFGGLTPNEFLEKWWDNTTRPDGKKPVGWKYPLKNGFELDDDERPIKANVNLTPGTLVDRFGEPTGKFDRSSMGSLLTYIGRTLHLSCDSTLFSKSSSPWESHHWGEPGVPQQLSRVQGDQSIHCSGRTYQTVVWPARLWRAVLPWCWYYGERLPGQRKFSSTQRISLD